MRARPAVGRRTLSESRRCQLDSISLSIARHDGVIGFADFSSRELLAQQTGRFLRRRGQNHATDRHVQPMRHRQIRHRFPQLRSQSAFERIDARRRLSGQASGFVHCQPVSLLLQYLDQRTASLLRLVGEGSRLL